MTAVFIAARFPSISSLALWPLALLIYFDFQLKQTIIAFAMKKSLISAFLAAGLLAAPAHALTPLPAPVPASNSAGFTGYFEKTFWKGKLSLLFGVIDPNYVRNQEIFRRYETLTGRSAATAKASELEPFRTPATNPGPLRLYDRAPGVALRFQLPWPRRKSGGGEPAKHPVLSPARRPSGPSSTAPAPGR
jgi:hypothetical protein